LARGRQASTSGSSAAHRSSVNTILPSASSWDGGRWARSSSPNRA
jgi:hypothetical protein